MNSKIIGFCMGVWFTTTGVAQSVSEAEKVIARFVDQSVPVSLSISLDKQNGCDVFQTTVSNDSLYIQGSSPVALCRGFYDFVKQHHIGLQSWSGKRVDWPQKLSDQSTKTVTSPYAHHYYFNVVTFGYSMPYWNWERWEQEIDWMALHGIDMPLALVANEAISARVWKKLGLSDEEIAHYFVGPAHLPWMRMGNISGIDGPLSSSWHDKQIALQHRILKRMRALGMKPVCPGFAGFVPQSLQRLYPDLKLLETSWCGGAFHNWMLPPDHPLFRKIGKMFIEEWEQEFGENGYYIVDSFNEMEIPFPPKESPQRYELLANYGNEVYNSIREGNPNAVWVMQGWMFGYQRHIWDYKTLQALVSRVPNDKMLLLDLAVDYNRCFWKSEPNWEFYKGMFNKPWVYSVIPNMGGKTGLTGVLDFYANGRLDALQSPNKGVLAGYGMAPEGIENNEVIYELICDGGWSDAPIDVDSWLDNYSLCRYGFNAPALQTFWKEMRQSVYGSFTDHPRYNWQFRPGTVRKGSICVNDSFYRAIEHFAEALPDSKSSPLFQVDLLELTAHYLGAKMEEIIQAWEQAFQKQDFERMQQLETAFETLATGADRVLQSHPVLRLDRWLSFARQQGNNADEQADYVKNARRIVTVWGPPVDDYSARIWSGLIRDYYLPRWKQYFADKRNGQPSQIAAWELDWVAHGYATQPQPYTDVVKACLALIAEARQLSLDELQMEKNIIGSWSPSDLSGESSSAPTLSWNVSGALVRELKGVCFQWTVGKEPLAIQQVQLELDGKTYACPLATKESLRTKGSVVYTVTLPAEATANNSCRLQVKLQSKDYRNAYGQVTAVLEE